MEYLDIILSIVAGLAAAIPLVIKLVQYVQKAIKEKNWGQLLDLVMSLMEEAEEKFADGATRKEWVMAMVQASAESINYDIDLAAISELIDSLCDLTKKVNAPEPEMPEQALSAGEQQQVLGVDAPAVPQETEKQTPEGAATAERSLLTWQQSEDSVGLSQGRG